MDAREGGRRKTSQTDLNMNSINETSLLMNGQGPNNNAAVKKQIYQTAYILTLWGWASLSDCH